MLENRTYRPKKEKRSARPLSRTSRDLKDAMPRGAVSRLKARACDDPVGDCAVSCSDCISDSAASCGTCEDGRSPR